MASQRCNAHICIDPGPRKRHVHQAECVYSYRYRPTAGRTTVLSSLAAAGAGAAGSGADPAPALPPASTRTEAHSGDSGANRSAFVPNPLRAQRTDAQAPRGAEDDGCACVGWNYGAFLQTAAAYVTGVKVGASASNFRISHAMGAGYRLLVERQICRQHATPR